MSLSGLQAAMDARFATINFDASRVIMSNETYLPTAGKGYLAAQCYLTSVSGEGSTLGASKSVGGAGTMVRWDGSYRVDCVWPQDAGIDGANQLVDMVLALFPRGLTLGTGDDPAIRIVFNAPTPTPATDDGSGVWVRGSVSCPWFAFIQT
jgi:hypothetical protein